MARRRKLGLSSDIHSRAFVLPPRSDIVSLRADMHCHARMDGIYYDIIHRECAPRAGHWNKCYKRTRLFRFSLVFYFFFFLLLFLCLFCCERHVSVTVVLPHCISRVVTLFYFFIIFLHKKMDYNFFIFAN